MTDDIDKEWEMEKATFRGKIEALSVSMQLFCEQAKSKGFGLENTGETK
jgi:hypothetical protein